MRLTALIILSAGLTPSALGYSVLTHEAIIDTAWKDTLMPVLLKRFPGATPEELRKAHAYAYGGAIIQDLGYYPFGNKLFSDLVHYVRSGDFVENLLKEATDLNEYAFALGALAHTAADNQGHSIATNHAVAELYPKLKAKYGNVVTYDEDPTAHLKVEFGFDVSQVAKNHYAPDAYRDFIGFEVAKPLLERAFLDTYSIKFESLFLSVDLALGTFRHTVSSLIPEMTKVAWESKKGEIEKTAPGITRKKFLYNLSRADYSKQWDGEYQKPGIWARFLAFLFKIVPKVGPFKSLAFHPLTPHTELLFMQSFDATLERYRAALRGASNGPIQVPNMNLDTGQPVKPGTYPLADETYVKLMDREIARNSVESRRPSTLIGYATAVPFATGFFATALVSEESSCGISRNPITRRNCL